MIKLKFASAVTSGSANCILFGANTLCAGTAPTTAKIERRENAFCADIIRKVDNIHYSLPENYRLGDKLWDAGNLKIHKHDKSSEIIQVKEYIGSVLSQNKVPICLGGDHMIKYAAIAALNDHKPGEFGIIYIDAHPDCEVNDSVSYSSILHHGFLLEDFQPEQVMLVGLRQFTENEAQALKKYSEKIGILSGTDFYSFSVNELIDKTIQQFKGINYLYFSIDLDGLDTASAPGVESPYPGGPTLGQVIYFIQTLAKHFRYIGMDISEYLPEQDVNHITAFTAARLIKEFYSVAC